MEMSTNITELAKAMVKVQATLKPVLKDSDNPFFKSKYADLAAVWENCRKALTDNGFSVIQAAENENGNVLVKTLLLHESGEFISSSLCLHPVKSDPQGIGSAITYGRRYALTAIVGICAEDEDDDGNNASGNVKIPPKKAAPPIIPPSIESPEVTKKKIEDAIKEYCIEKKYNTNSFSVIVEDILCDSYKVLSLHDLKDIQLRAICKNIDKLIGKAEVSYIADDVKNKEAKEEELF